MSADNFYIVRRHPDGGYAAVMGFASDLDEHGNEVIPEVSQRHPRFPTMFDALEWANNEYAEYGVSVHPECLDPVSTQEPAHA